MNKYAVPCIISLLVGELYNIVDQFFITNTDYLDSYGNAANTVVFPLTVIALAIADMLGDGAAANMSLCFGRSDKESAAKSAGNAMTLAVALGVVITIQFEIFLGPLC